MDIETAQAIVAKLTYKPGWELECYPQGEPAGGVVLRFGKSELDSEINDGKTTKPLMLATTLASAVLNQMSESGLLQFIFDTVVQRELHEIEEWLRYDGNPLKEPHPNLGKRGVLGNGTSLEQPVPWSTNCTGS